MINGSHFVSVNNVWLNVSFIVRVKVHDDQVQVFLADKSVEIETCDDHDKAIAAAKEIVRKAYGPPECYFLPEA